MHPVFGVTKKDLVKLGEGGEIDYIINRGDCLGAKRGDGGSEQGTCMIRVVNLIFFLGCALAAAHYYGWASAIQVFAAVAVTLGLMRILTSKRIN